MITDHEASPAWSGTARVVRGNDVLEEASAGFAAGRGGPLCTSDLRYQAGSISKLVVSVVVLSLLERGEVVLDQPIGRWLGRLSSQWQPVTLHQLLSHTSGMGHWGDITDLPATFLTAPPARDDLMTMIVDAPLVHHPGAAWRYSGPGFLVAASVVEAVTGSDYGVVASELVFDRLGLQGTTSGQFPAGHDGVALGHRDGEVAAVPPGFTQIPGTGDLWTTTDDLIAVSQALRAGDLLREDTAARLWTPHVALREPAGDGPVTKRAYGYGSFLGQVKGKSGRIHPGDNPGYQSLLAYFPDGDLDLVILCNENAPSVAAALDSLTTV